jgi:hypothetical protein
MSEETAHELITLERSVGETIIRATVEISEPIGLQYLRILQYFDIMEIMERSRRFWTTMDNQPRIVEVKSEDHRIILSLLISYPQFKTQQDIIAETSLHSGSVSRNLSGARGDIMKFVEEQGKSYRLNGEGFRWIRQVLLPELEKEIEAK